MKTPRLLLLLAAACCLAVPTRAQQALHTDQSGNPTTPLNAGSSKVTGIPKLQPAPYIGANWIYSSFNDIGSPNETLNLSYSQNGINWTTTTPSYSAPAGNGVRDPSIIYLNGVYYVAYTAGSFGGFSGTSYFQICQSTDLVNWTYLCNVNTSNPGGASWAPEWFVDRDGTVYLFASFSQPGGYWRAFYATATNLSLTTWTGFTEVGGDMPGRGAIDPQVVRDGDTYYLLYRNYGGGGGTDCIEMAKGTSPTAFSLYQTGNWAGWGTPREGPSLVHLGGLRWRIYFSLVTSTLPASGGEPIAYSDSADGMATWTAPAATGLPQHGTILALNAVGGSKNIPSAPTSTSPALAVSSATTLSASAAGQTVVCTGTTANYTVTLPTAASFSGKSLPVLMDSGLSVLVTLARTGSDLIDGQATRVMHNGESATLYSDGSTWRKIAGKTIPLSVTLTSATYRSIASGWAPVLLDVLVAGSPLMQDATNDRINIPRSGTYHCEGFFQQNGAQINYISFARNNTTTGPGSGVTGFAQLFSAIGNYSTSVPCTAGDYLCLEANSSSGSAILATAPTAPQMTATEVPSW